MLYFSDAYTQQDSEIRKLGTREGLPSMTVYDVTVDNQGFVWLATASGPCRYDGQSFQTFEAEGLPALEVLNLYLDKQKRLWFLYYNGTVAYYQNGIFHTVNNDNEIAEIRSLGIFSAKLEDESGNFWLGGMDVLYKVNTENKVELYAKSSVEKASARLRLDEYGRVHLFWAFATTQAQPEYCLDGQGLVEEVNDMEEDYSAWCFGMRQQGKYFDLHIIHNNQLKIKNKISQSLAYYTSPSDSSPEAHTILNTFIYQDSLFYLAQKRGGIAIFSPKGYRETLWKNAPISALQILPNGTYCIATMGEGFWIYSNTLNRFSAFNAVGEKSYYGILVQQGKLWLSSDSPPVIHEIDLATKQVLHHPFPSSVLLPTGTRILQMETSNSGIFVLGDMGLSLYHPESKKAWDSLVYVKFIPKKATKVTGNHILAAGKHQIWEYKEGNCRRIIENNQHVFTEIFVQDSLFYWLGTTRGLFSYQVSTQELKPLLILPINPFLCHVKAIQKDGLGLVWVAIDGYGIVGLRGTKIVHQFSIENGLLSNHISDLKIDAENHIWVGHTNGISQIQQVKNSFIVNRYNQLSGLNSTDVRSLYLAGDSLWVATAKGVFVANRKYLKQDRYNSIPSIILKHNNKSYYNSSEISIPHDNMPYYLKLEYPFFETGSLAYSYRINQGEWTFTKDPNITLRALAPGKYKIEVVAINAVGTQSKSRIISIQIIPAWWQRTWVQITGLLFIFSALLALFWMRYRQIQRRELADFQKEQQITELTSRYLTNQMNPHFIFNSLHTLQVHILNKNENSALVFLSDFAELMRTMLLFSGVKTISFREEIRFLSLYIEVEKAGIKQDFSFDLQVSDEILGTEKIPPMLIQPFIENALKHGLSQLKDRKAELKLHIRYWDSSTLECIIEDNGIGRTAASKQKLHEGKSMGLDITLNRLRLYQVKEPVFSIVDLEPQAGTRVILRIPVLG